MLITSVVLKNFGRHAQLQFDCNAHVVGLLGPNGVGKSTVLDALEFALTGETRDPLPTYVRHGSGNASVDMTFVKHGRQGKIFRQFGKTTKRSLEWDGKVVTSAKEVDATMAGIFCADKYAIANAVFINQGMLEHILFSKEADRRQLFIRLVGMAYCEQRAHILEGKMKKIQTTIVDLGPMLDAANRQIAEAQESMDRAQAVVDASPDYSAAWTFADRFVQLEVQLSTLMAQIGDAENDCLSYHKQLEAAMSQIRVATVDQARIDLRRMEETVSKVSAELFEWKSIKAELIHHNRITTEITTKTRQLRERHQEQTAINPENLRPEDWTRYAEELEQRVLRRGIREARVRALEQAKRESASALKRLAEYPSPPHQRDVLAQRSVALEQKRVASSSGWAFLQRQSEIAHCANAKMVATETGQTALKCTTCGLLIANPEALAPDVLKQMEITLQQLGAEIEAETKALDQHRKELDAHTLEHDRLLVNVNHWAQQVAACEKNLDELPEDNAPGLDAEFARAQAVKRRLPDLEKEIVQLNSDVSQLIQTRSEYKKAAEHLSTAMLFTDTVESVRTRGLELQQQDLERLRTHVAEINRLDTTLRTLQEQQAKRLAAKKDYETAMDAPVPPEVVLLASQLQSNMVAVREELKARQSARDTATGVLNQAKQQVQQAKANFETLVQRRTADAKKQELLDDLVLLRDMLSPDGLPMDVVRYHFEYLARLTQEALNQLDANFSLLLDPADPFGFRFVRLDEPAHEPLPMNKLSGGQRVRLCTAFLIAVQQRLVREVGLLVLDEPSTHVDQAGVESLAELLRSLSAQLGNTETQILVSDHHPLLQTCFGKVLELK